jgi:hypothetical protein
MDEHKIGDLVYAGMELGYLSDIVTGDARGQWVIEWLVSEDKKNYFRSVFSNEEVTSYKARLIRMCERAEKYGRRA